MVLETTNKKVNLVLKTKKIVDIANSLKNKNFEDAFFKAMNTKDLDALSKIIYSLAENDEGKHAFNNSEEIYDFIDEYKKENNKTYDDIYKEIVDMINKEGFFNRKMTDKELKAMISNPLSQINLNDLTQKAVEKAIASVAETQITAQVQ
jgi:hypothetical protein